MTYVESDGNDRPTPARWWYSGVIAHREIYGWTFGGTAEEAARFALQREGRPGKGHLHLTWDAGVVTSGAATGTFVVDGDVMAPGHYSAKARDWVVGPCDCSLCRPEVRP